MGLRVSVLNVPFKTDILRILRILRCHTDFQVVVDLRVESVTSPACFAGTKAVCLYDEGRPSGVASSYPMSHF